MNKLLQIIPKLLTREKCDELVGFSEKCGFLIQPFGRSHSREIRRRVATEDVSIVQALWSLLSPYLLPIETYFDQNLVDQSRVKVDRYSFVGLNERLRFYKYHEGERFSRHFDIPFEKTPIERSFLSVIIYLNEEFDGGETRFYPPYEQTIQPQMGSAILFAHEMIHEGLAIKKGIKRVLRTDVMGRLASAG